MSKRDTPCVNPYCVAHHSCKAGRQDSTARANVQSFGSLVKLVMQKLQGIRVLGKEGTTQAQVKSDCRTTKAKQTVSRWPLMLLFAYLLQHNVSVESVLGI